MNHFLSVAAVLVAAGLLVSSMAKPWSVSAQSAKAATRKHA